MIDRRDNPVGKVLSAKELKQAFLAGANQLNARKDVING